MILGYGAVTSVPILNYYNKTFIPPVDPIHHLGIFFFTRCLANPRSIRHRYFW